ncbi:cryptococcal mannosyltransferase 1-domain-containing protein [Lophiotrema nucula]|uniref:Cryptococcal mannosyltransferase 1-domain-containing protein n=1 Tax=Lophiotrema nucula TaxID=690887 RepID=A0A6A5YV30_9PLEO|nr:cryptococcal mannosyltransferase 1-domain-containing protein [Lophiotrema nucula]
MEVLASKRSMCVSSVSPPTFTCLHLHNALAVWPCHSFYTLPLLEPCAPTMILMRRRHLLHTVYRNPIFRLLLVILFISDTPHVLRISSRQVEATSGVVPPPRSQKRIYIASQHWNDGILLRSRWNNALVELVQELGIGNVFVSIYESGSYDNGTTKEALGELDVALGDMNVKRRISLSDVTHAEEIEKQPSGHGWVKTPQGKVELRRIPFLARLRN